MVANDNNYMPDINGTTSDPSPANSQSIIAELQNLQNYITRKESTIRQLNEEIAKLKNENKALRSSSGLKMPPQKQYQSTDLKRVIAKAVESAVESVLSDLYADSGMQSPSRGPLYQASSPHLTQPSTPDRSIDENTNSATSNFIYETNSSETSGHFSHSFQKVNEARKLENSDLGQETTEETLQFSKHNEDEVTPSDLTAVTSSMNGSTRLSNNNSNYNSNYNNGYYNNNNGRRHNNNYNNNNMAKRKQAHTAFVSWTGQMSPDTVQSLFPSEDVREIRQSQTKSFAHIDFMDSSALDRALLKNGMDLSRYNVQGSLRVEKGKPRDNNNNNNNNNNNSNYNYNNNSQRLQYQTQNPNQQNKNRNGPSNNSSSINSTYQNPWNNFKDAESSSVITSQQEQHKQEE